MPECIRETLPLGTGHQLWGVGDGGLQNGTVGGGHVKFYLYNVHGGSDILLAMLKVGARNVSG